MFVISDSLFETIAAPKEKMLPQSTTVHNLKQMCKKCFGVDPENQMLVFLIPGPGEIPVRQKYSFYTVY